MKLLIYFLELCIILTIGHTIKPLPNYVDIVLVSFLLNDPVEMFFIYKPVSGIIMPI